MHKRSIPFGIAAIGVASLTGLTFAAASTAGARPAPVVSTNRSHDATAHDRGDDHRVDTSVPITTTTPTAPPTTVTTLDDHGVDDPATHDVGVDHGVDASAPTAGIATDDPATHDVGDDRGVDNPPTHDVGDDNGANRGRSGSGNSGSGNSGGHGRDN